jgi:hypothetical protein
MIANGVVISPCGTGGRADAPALAAVQKPEVATLVRMCRMQTRMVGHVLAALMCGAIIARAQIPDSVPSHCDGKTITSIEVQPLPPAMIGRSPSTWRRTVQRVLLQSTSTREDVVRSFLLVRVGQRCSEALLAEAARVLRSRPYIASASVRAVTDSAQAVHVVVETVDEIPLVIGGGWRSGSLSDLTFGNANLQGYGVQLVGRWRQGDAYRDGLTLGFRKHGIFQQPVVLALDLVRNPLGGQLSYSFTRPFLSDLQHIAWHAGGQQSTSYYHIVRPSGPTLLLPVQRDVWTMGAVARLAWRNRGVLLGPVATYERSRPGINAVVASDSGLVPPDTNVVGLRYPSYKNLRLGGALGLRLLDFQVVHGFDALLGDQDIARGVQLGALVARGLGASDRNDFVSADLYTGAGGQSSFVGLRLEGEGERRRDTNEWGAVVASGRAAWYAKPSDTRTVVASLEFTGGWRERLPLQLSLGDARAGIRGYKDAAIAGGRRALLRLEQRHAVASLGRLAHMGAAFFADVGKTWAGDVPFGETTVARASAGAGLLVALPPRSRRMLRADIAVPVTGGAPKRWLLRIAAFDATRAFWREPSDIASQRAGAPPSSIFGWP